MKLPMKLLIAGLIMCFVTIIVGWVAIPMIIKYRVKAVKNLKPGSMMRDIWAQLPIPLQFKIHLFNVTNPEGIQNGEKPIVKEVGPYYYDEYQEKVDLEDRDEDDTVEYNLLNTWHFNPSKSNGLTGDEVFVYPQLAILGMILVAVKDEPALVGVVASAIDTIFNKPNSIFVKLTAKEILFDGITIDCNIDDYLAVSICGALRTEVKQIIVVGEGLYRISLLGHKNHTLMPRIRVSRGSKMIADVGRILEWNHETEMTVWSGDPCNKLSGTDATIYRPFMYENDDIGSFIPDVCRSFDAKFVSNKVVHGVKTKHYTADLGDSSTEPEDKCFCPRPGSCLKRGAMDITSCLGIPIVVTLPHFYLTDPSYSESIIGMHPTKEEHEVYIDFEPLTGTPVSAWKRLQYNIFIFPVAKFKPMRNFSDALLPLVWVEEGIELSDAPDLLNQLTTILNIITFLKYVVWIILILGIVITGVGGGLEFVRRKKGQNVKIMSLSLAQVNEDDLKGSPRAISTVSQS